MSANVQEAVSVMNRHGYAATAKAANTVIDRYADLDALTEPQKALLRAAAEIAYTTISTKGRAPLRH